MVRVSGKRQVRYQHARSVFFVFPNFIHESPRFFRLSSVFVPVQGHGVDPNNIHATDLNNVVGTPEPLFVPGLNGRKLLAVRRVPDVVVSVHGEVVFFWSR